jgi:hypothetical protein
MCRDDLRRGFALFDPIFYQANVIEGVGTLTA